MRVLLFISEFFFFANFQIFYRSATFDTRYTTRIWNEQERCGRSSRQKHCSIHAQCRRSSSPPDNFVKVGFEEEFCVETRAHISKSFTFNSPHAQEAGCVHSQGMKGGGKEKEREKGESVSAKRRGTAQMVDGLLD